MSKLAQRVRDFRYSKGWGPDELASRAAISRTALYQIESGKTELPRAGTLRRIALALDVTMETLLGHDAAAAIAQHAAATAGAPNSGPRVREMVTPWVPVEGSALGTNGQRPGRYESVESRFGMEYGASADAQAHARERELVKKLHELLATPLGDPVARIVEETHRLLPQVRVASTYD